MALMPIFWGREYMFVSGDEQRPSKEFGPSGSTNGDRKTTELLGETNVLQGGGELQGRGRIVGKWVDTR